MNKASGQARQKKVTLGRIANELRRLKERVEDLEDLRDLDEAIARNKGKPGTPWAQVKKELDLESDK